MKKIFKKSFVICMALVMALASMSAFAFADDGSKADSESDNEFVVTGYDVSRTTIRRGNSVYITLKIKYNSTSSPGVDLGALDISRLNDSFSGGTIKEGSLKEITGGSSFAFEVTFEELKYKGVGQSFKIMIRNGATAYQPLETTITEAAVYKEPAETPSVPSTPDPIPSPKAVVSRNELPHDIKAGETMTLDISIKNVGKANMQNPVVSFTTSDSLMIVGGASSFQLGNINTGRTATVQLQVKGLKDIQSANQYIDAEIEFDYYNRVNTQNGTAKGRVTVPAYVKEKKDDNKKEEEEPTSPVPNIIVTKFNYGSSSVPAGSEFNFSFKFKNTSSELNVENLVVTAEGGEGMMINGSTNSFFFNKVKPGASKSVSIPMKVMKTVTNGAQTVSLNFKYEYVDHKKRTSTSADIKLSVPVYQPDKFEISNPVVPDYITEGDEISITLNYVNKSKTDIANVQASLEGDVQSASPLQTVGNLEPGKNGTIAFAITAAAAGESSFDIKVSYEDGNGDSKERIFPVTMDVQAMQPSDPGMDDPGMDDPDAEEGGFNWWIVAAVAVVLGIVTSVILKKRKKAKAAKKEQELWDSWDDELNGTNDTNDTLTDAGNKGDK